MAIDALCIGVCARKLKNESFPKSHKPITFQKPPHQNLQEAKQGPHEILMHNNDIGSRPPHLKKKLIKGFYILHYILHRRRKMAVLATTTYLSLIYSKLGLQLPQY